MSRTDRTARVTTSPRPTPGPRRRAPQPHDQLVSRARRGRPQARRVDDRRVQRPQRSGEPRPILKTLTKVVARALLTLVILAIFVFGVFPTGSYMEQRNELNRAVNELEQLNAENESLQERVARLESDEEIERVARQEFDMQFPEEESLLILPPGG